MRENKATFKENFRKICKYIFIETLILPKQKLYILSWREAVFSRIRDKPSVLYQSSPTDKSKFYTKKNQKNKYIMLLPLIG